MVAGLASAGVDVQRLGVLPTPAVAFLTGALDADLGVMISASHNPMPDNGIKFFARGGHKLDDAIEDAIEARLREPWDRPTGAAVGRVATRRAAAASSTSTTSSAPCRTASTALSVVLDCANGAASRVAPAAFAAAGATVAHHPRPHRRLLNINDGCGSTHLDDLLRPRSYASGADVGFAFDGDADRCLAADAAGKVVDGDQILAILALAMRDARRAGRRHRGRHRDEQPRLPAGAGAASASPWCRRAVGDRYVLEAMQAGGYVLGGEQSGHVIMLDHATTGDGLLTALHVAEQLAATGAVAAELAAVMTRLPQVLVNVPGVDKSRAAQRPRRRGRGGRGGDEAGRRRAGCCCARPAPSRWCGSWSRRRPPSAPTRSPARLADVVERALALNR